MKVSSIILGAAFMIAGVTSFAFSNKKPNLTSAYGYAGGGSCVAGDLLEPDCAVGNTGVQCTVITSSSDILPAYAESFCVTSLKRQ